MTTTPQGAVGDRSTPRLTEPVDGSAGGSSRAEVRRAALSSFIGTTVEYYDFLLYGSASALVFSKIFFTNLSPAWATVASFASFAAGYVARLVGGLVFAHIGDRSGRKSVLIVTMLVMGVSTGLMGLLPTYGQIGVAAPVLLVVLRLVQGLAAGGEYGGAALMSAEHAPNKRRGLVGTATTVGLPFGGLLGTAAFAIASTLSPEAFLGWGWRVPFLFGFVLVGIGLWIRLQVSETPAFTAAQASAPSAARRLPLATMFRRQPLAVLRGIFLVMPSLAMSSLFGSYLIAYAVSIGYTSSQALLALIIAAFVGVLAIPAWGALSDRIGRRPVFLIGAVGVAVLAYPALAMIDTVTFAGLCLAQILIGAIVSTATSGPLVAILSEMFETDVRYTGVAMTYQTGTVIAGGFAPLLAAVLVASNVGLNGGAVISVMLVVLAVAAVIAMLFSPESRGRDLTQPTSTRIAPRQDA